MVAMFFIFRYWCKTKDCFASLVAFFKQLAIIQKINLTTTILHYFVSIFFFVRLNCYCHPNLSNSNFVQKIMKAKL